MKLVVTLCALLLAVSFVAASTESYPGVFLTSKVIGTWNDSVTGVQYTQYDITLHNNSQRNIKQIFIGTDATFKVRNGTDYWNVVRIHNGDLVLPDNQDVNAGATYTFGFILQGSTPANLVIKYIAY